MTIATSPRASGARAQLTDARNSISFIRLLWVAPLVVAAGVVINSLIAYAAQTIDPSFGVPATGITTLTLEGCIGAVLVFAGLAYFVPRPIFWYRVVSTIAVVLSLAPVVALGMGGSFALLGLQLISQVEGIGVGAQPRDGGGPMPDGGPPAGGPPAGGGLPDGIPGAPIELVLLLALMHVAAYVMCVALLPALTRRRTSSALPLLQRQRF